MEVDLVPRYPHAQTVSFSLLDKPIIEFEVQPLNAQVNLMEVPGLAPVSSRESAETEARGREGKKGGQITLQRPQVCEGGPRQYHSVEMTYVTCLTARSRFGSSYSKR
jgi:hypothetical protein